MVGASVATSPIKVEIIACRERGNTMKAVAKTVGIMPPPIKPWIARHTIISPMLDDMPHIRLAKVKPPAEIANTHRVPSARDKYPDSGIITTSAIR